LYDELGARRLCDAVEALKGASSGTATIASHRITTRWAAASICPSSHGQYGTLKPQAQGADLIPRRSGMAC
jgi:hypothetical protein